MKDIFENIDCVYFTIKIHVYQMPDPAWAPPFVSMITYPNIFMVVFPAGKARYVANGNL
jgi:hypothetical protein